MAVAGDTSSPALHLSGERLRSALQSLIGASEKIGGIERFVAAVRMRAEVIGARLGDGRAGSLERAAFAQIVPFMPTVRRRIGPLLDGAAWPTTRAAIEALLDDARAPGTGDARIAAFEAALRPRLSRPVPQGRTGDRFVRDLAAEILHATHPEHYPLMTRWVWDAQANTGVLREIWHDPATGTDDVDRLLIDVPDRHETFLVLRQELSQFLSDQGIFRDMLWYVDLLQAHIYGDYINAQGGAFLKTDFNAAAADPVEHTRRILGLDGRSGRGARRVPVAAAEAEGDTHKRLS